MLFYHSLLGSCILSWYISILVLPFESMATSGAWSCGTLLAGLDHVEKATKAELMDVQTLEARVQDRPLPCPWVSCLAMKVLVYIYIYIYYIFIYIYILTKRPLTPINVYMLN